MSRHHQNNKSQKFIQSLIGLFILTLGITLILVWRHEVVLIFKGVTGMALALAGLLVLYGLSKK